MNHFGPVWVNLVGALHIAERDREANESEDVPGAVGFPHLGKFQGHWMDVASPRLLPDKTQNKENTRNCQYRILRRYKIPNHAMFWSKAISSTAAFASRTVLRQLWVPAPSSSNLIYYYIVNYIISVQQHGPLQTFMWLPSKKVNPTVPGCRNAASAFDLEFFAVAEAAV